MPVVEQRPPPNISTNSNQNTEEQISELNELLCSVLDEIQSLKNAIYDNARKEKKSSKHSKKRLEEETSSEEEEESPPTKRKNPSEKPPTQRRGIDFSNCF